MGIYKVAFFGHRKLYNIFEVEDILYDFIKNYISDKGFVEFYVGRNGDFDICVSSVIKRIKKDLHPNNIAHILVLPYPTLEYIENDKNFEEYFDQVDFFDFSGRVHPKAVIGKRNRDMVDEADLVVCYIERESGGAYSTVRYAQSKGKKVVNLFKNQSEEV